MNNRGSKVSINATTARDFGTVDDDHEEAVEVSESLEKSSWTSL